MIYVDTDGRCVACLVQGVLVRLVLVHLLVGLTHQLVAAVGVLQQNEIN